jgi:hypothetical protein
MRTGLSGCSVSQVRLVFALDRIIEVQAPEHEAGLQRIPLIRTSFQRH